MIKKSIYKMLVATIFLSSCGGDLGSRKHNISGVILDVGSCGGGEGFFGGNYTCSVKIMTRGRVEYWQAYGQQIKGKTLYKECWMEGDGAHCFVTASNRAREMYKNK